MLTIEASVLTHAGCVRTNNEDSVSLVRPRSAGESAPHEILAIVADGMGGHEGGETASHIAVESMTRSYVGSCLIPPKALTEAFAASNRDIFAAAKANPSLQGMGTTCIAVAVRDDYAWWAWVGDSRMYLLRRGQAYRMMEDHTVVNDLVYRGLLTAEEAHYHPERSVLSRAMGSHPSVEAAVADEGMQLVEGDRLLLCTDGLHDLVADEEVAGLALGDTVDRCAGALLQTALDRGGYDNVSLILLDVRNETATAKKPAIITREFAFP
jgi:PPM family protein phosphatase